MIPQILWIALVGMSFGIEMKRHGQPKEGKHSIVITIISLLLNAIILYYGGFFNALLR